MGIFVLWVFCGKVVGKLCWKWVVGVVLGIWLICGLVGRDCFVVFF